MAQMAYFEVALNIDMDWSTIPMSLQTHMKPKILQRTLWFIETHPIDPFEHSKSYHSLEVFTPPNVCLDENAHDDEINLDQDFLGMFEGGDMDQNNFDCAILSVMIGNNVMK
jgi:hypothetical protein